MKRPDISIERHNLIFYIGVGIGWIISALLGLINDSITVKFLVVIINLILVSLLLYSLIAKRERDDELTLSYSERARSFGYLVFSCSCCIFFSFDLLYEDIISLHFAAPFILGISHLAVGWKFHCLEKYGDK